jgi:quinol-cytochrome oxidoreductase complex cytochrome b subunit
MMVFVLFLHMLRVFWYGGYKRPREVTWIFGSALLLLTMLFGFTGYLLPMDQVSYWGTVVATEPMFGLPLAGDLVGRIARGGTEVNDSTLSRFFIIHVFILPASVGALVAAHLYLVGRNGISTKESVTDEMSHGYSRAFLSSTTCIAR